MKKPLTILCTAALLLATQLGTASERLDPRLIGTWQGLREQDNGCVFLAWTSQLNDDGRFAITFFADKERTQPIQTEHGQWSASNGRSELKTDSVNSAEVYLYTVVNADQVDYTNTVKDPTADCQADYAFSEHRIKSAKR